MGRDRNETGRFDDAIPPEDVLDIFDALEDTARPLTASDVIDELGIARRTAHNKLNRLVERGELETRKVGARGRVWWVPHTDGIRDRSRGGPDRRETLSDQAVDQTPSVPDDRSEGNDTPALEGDDLRDHVRSVLPGSGKTLERRVDAVLEMYDFIRNQGGDTVRTGELKDLVDPDAVGYSSVRSFWNNAVKKNAAQDRPNALTSLPDVEDLGNGRYRYTGADNA